MSCRKIVYIIEEMFVNKENNYRCGWFCRLCISFDVEKDK